MEEIDVSNRETPTDDRAAQELESARRHADPSKGDKKAEGGDRVDTHDEDPIDNPGN